MPYWPYRVKDCCRDTERRCAACEPQRQEHSLSVEPMSMAENSRDSRMQLRIERLQAAATAADGHFGDLSSMEHISTMSVEMNKVRAGPRSKRLPRGETRVPWRKTHDEGDLRHRLGSRGFGVPLFLIPCVPGFAGTVSPREAGRRSPRRWSRPFRVVVRGTTADAVLVVWAQVGPRGLRCPIPFVL